MKDRVRGPEHLRNHVASKFLRQGRKVMIVEYPNMIWKGQDICVRHSVFALRALRSCKSRRTGSVPQGLQVFRASHGPRLACSAEHF